MELIKMNASRKKPMQNDVFVIQPKENMYLYGVVAKSNIINNDSVIFNGWNLIYVYNIYSNEKKFPVSFKPKQLLIPPIVVNNQGWLKGYFETVGRMEIIDYSIAKEYGFLNFVTKKFVNEEGKVLSYQPRKWADYGLGNYLVVESHIEKVLNEDPDLYITH